jgi:carboxyl-terminal processing protease
MKLLKHKKSILVAIPTPLLIFSLFAFKQVDFKTSKNLDIFFSFFRELTIFYVDKTDAEKLIQVGIDAMLESLDPYNEFISEDNIDALEFQTTGEYGGMGALIRHGEFYPVIAEVYEGSPAHKAGIIAGDVIKSINGNSVKQTPVDVVSKMLKGVPNTDLNVVVERFGQPDSLSFVFKRERIHIPSVPYYGMISDEVGYIRLANFTSNCHKEVENALKDLKSKNNAKGIVLELRGNPGGLLYEAVRIVNIFVDRNQLVVYTRGQIKEFDQEYKTSSRPIDTQIPLIVLVDRVSASASEIVAGALQDLDRAVVVGERTFGKGLVQATRPLPYNTQLKITTAKYYIPSGRCIQAVDFTQRNDDGSIRFIPDSLISEFKTQNGRSVYDGGGIAPDIEHRSNVYSRIATVLYTRNMFFEYATQFRAKNESIATPNKFNLDNKQYNDFIKFIDSQGFEYVSQTETQLNELIKTAKHEKYYQVAHSLLDSLESTIKNNRLKDLQFFESEIKSLLEEEIVGRYYLQRGKAKYNVSKDDAIALCLSIISDKSKFNQVLTTNTKKLSFNANTSLNSNIIYLQENLSAKSKVSSERNSLLMPS